MIIFGRDSYKLLAFLHIASGVSGIVSFRKGSKGSSRSVSSIEERSLFESWRLREDA
jgi:hypothetical protein